ncbi:MAG: glycosyltransferase family 4 protein [Steroidobacteraceae bacterium]|nr:glycosyltransferase family 4 protein [Steroidobacteraceae bacterium]
MNLSLVLTGNEPRQRYLFETLRQVADVRAVVPFDDIDLATKLAAAALSFARPRSEWWGNYQMHPLVQRRRQRVLVRELERAGVHGGARADALVMWGSWFQPFAQGDAKAIPYVNYIDQSRSLEPLPGEARARFTRRKKSHALQAETYAGALAVLCMSKWARQQTLEAHVLPEDKVVDIGWGPCGVDLSTEDLAAKPREPIVLHVSNDFHRKGVDRLFDTAVRVRKAVPRAQFVVIGKDSSGLVLRSESNVQVLGPIYDKAQLADYFRRASLFFLPHRFDRSPHVLVEAMSAALPIVTSDQGGPVELLSGNRTGILCPSGDIGAYTDAIVTLLTDEPTRIAMGRNAVALMRERYTWVAVARRLVQVIQDRLAAGAHSGTTAGQCADAAA